MEFDNCINNIICGDNLEILKAFPDESIDCIMTSPPYWALRDYEHENQLGLEHNFNDYINNLVLLFSECKRVLKKTGACWVNLGDVYYGGGRGASGKNNHCISKQEWDRPSRKAFSDIEVNKTCLYCGKEFQGKSNSQFCSKTCLNKMGNDFRSQNRLLPDKTLCLIPFRFSIAMLDAGWICRNTIIWHKPNAMPQSVKDRFTVDFEYLFFFVKSKKYYFEQQFEAFSDNTYERIKSGNSNDSKMAAGIAAVSISGYDKYRENIKNGTLKGSNKRTTWTIPTQPFPGDHFATYPEKLCETPIKSTCPENGIVLDPFSGAGTTCKMAKMLNRRYIGIELNTDYWNISKERLNNITPLFDSIEKENGKQIIMFN